MRLAKQTQPEPMTTPPVTPVRLSLRLVAVLALGFALPARAQGPSAPAETRPATSPVSGEVSAKRANVARLAADDGAPYQATPRPLGRWSASALDLRDSILISVVRSTVGTRYRRGGQSVDRGFDCSGLVRYIMSALEVRVPRTAAEQAESGLAVGRDATRLRPGDVLTFGRDARGVSHVGIYIGNGRYVHASSVAGRVIESDLRRPAAPRTTPWRDSRRVLSGSTADSTVSSDG